MAVFALINAQVLVNSVDLSDHARKVTIEDNRDTVDITTFGAASKAVTKGLGDAKMTIEFLQDFAAAKVHATLQPLISSATPVSIEIRPFSGPRSSTNPGILMQGLLMTYNPLDGAIGDASSFTAEFVNGANAGISYNVV